ncbi:MAG: rhomboid family intramembrane serine protease [Gemmatimonadetes bacterium]|nr:rhomboid family intramembrane serine protease [Gemmatimonadota bacterium]
MDRPTHPRLTPWVTRLLIANGAVLLLLETVFTAPRFANALLFDPARFGDRPWTVLTYFAVHRNPTHLLVTAAMLLLFGPAVERRLGSTRFIGFYVYCGIGAALFALGLSSVLRLDPFAGASGAVYGIMLAYVMYWPDAQLSLHPLPISLTARSVFAALLIADVALGLLGRTNMAHFAHLGGAAAGYAFIRLQMLTTRRPTPRPSLPTRQPVVTPMRVHESAAQLRPAAPVSPDAAPEVSGDEVDRLLDKIARSGMNSLTTQERKYLHDASAKKRRDQV